VLYDVKKKKMVFIPFSREHFIIVCDDDVLELVMSAHHPDTTESHFCQTADSWHSSDPIDFFLGTRTPFFSYITSSQHSSHHHQKNLTVKKILLEQQPTTTPN
jgi:hypothetical protein